MIKVLAKTDRILREIAARPGLPFGDLQAAVDLHKATLSNLLKTLTALGYTARDERGGCHLGPTLLELAGGQRLRQNLPRVAAECAGALAETLRETVTIGRLVAGDRYNLAKATVDRTVTVNARIEFRPSPYDTATGRALLAFCTPDELATTVSKHGLPGAAWDGIASHAELDRALAAIRRRGWAELRLDEACCFAVPALTADGALLAAIGTAVPSFRFTAADHGPILASLRAAASHLVEALDLNPEPPAP